MIGKATEHRHVKQLWHHVLQASPVVLVLLGTACSRQAADPNLKYFEAVAAAKDSNHAEAVRLLDEVLAAYPSTYGYLERAKSHVALGHSEEALADCEAGLKLESDHIDLKWLAAELRKPEESRFKGAQALPPSRYK